MKFTIVSDSLISDEIVKKISTILKESDCPNESLKNSIPGFAGFKDNIIQIEDGTNKTVYEYSREVEI